jgi:uncharacterized protein YukE
MKEAEVHMRCEDAFRSAAELQRQAEGLRRAATEYKATLDELEANWEGQSARRYLAVARERIDKLNSNVERYEALAVAIIKTARLYERNELKKIRSMRKKP